MDSGLYCTHTIARFFGLAVNVDQLKRQYVKPGETSSTLDILRAFKSIGLKAKTLKSSFSKLSNIPLPAIAQRPNGEYFILAKKVMNHDIEGFLVQEPGAKEVEVKDADWLEQNWNGHLILVTKRAGLASSSTAFGFKWFIPALLKYKELLSEVLIASAFIQLFALLTPIFFQVVMDKVMVHKGFTTLDVLAMGLIAVAVFEVVLSGLRTYMLSHTTSRVDVELGAQLYHHLLALPLTYFQTRRVGDSVARVREVDTIREFITGSALTLTIDLVFTVIVIAVLFLYSTTLALIVVGAIPFYVLLSFFITPVLRKRLNEKFSHNAERQAYLVETVTGIETIKSLSLEADTQRRWEDRSAAYVQSAFKANNLNNIASQAAQFISKIMMLGVLYFGAHAVIAGDLTVGQFISFNMLAGRVSGPILKIVHLWQDFQQAGISIKRLGDILNMPTEPKHNPSRTTLPKLSGKVEFEHVSFKYKPDGKEIIKDFSLSVEPGQVIGIVGRSGSGKSTLTKLIQRLYVPNTGRVLIDGVDLTMVNTGWLRRQIGVVLQENFLFNRSVRENISVADQGASVEKVIAAAKLSGAHEFILELSEGYDTIIEEQGANLSGGQRQRLAIARALISQPSILIMDEATSALDYESERIIQNNMQSITKGRTVFVIAHRLSTVRDADRILVMDKGRVVEDGNHHSLIEQDGVYAHLWAQQTKTPVPLTAAKQSPKMA